MVKLSSFVALFLLTVQISFAQTSANTVNQSIEWFALSSTAKVHKNVGLFVEGQFRFAQDLQPQQHQFRTAIEVYLSKKFAIVPVGYVYTWNHKYGKQPTAFINNEHRIYQQITYKHASGRFNVQHRLRMEERFLQSKYKASDGGIEGTDYSDERYRLRYRGLIYIPLNNAKIEAKTWFISLWDEVFVSWGKKVTYHKPDQNRLFTGVGYQFNKLVSIQGGFLYQMMKKSNGTLQENNYGGMLQLTYNLDFTKPSK
ncbi:MAG TPA: DUF2490 domain-containing protein [Cyclobacteriaceae bacterium]|jgi:hypothetical protein|nr:DUF2490 domain-containing protein [Cyclobacteriaceae bacterium]